MRLPIIFLIILCLCTLYPMRALAVVDDVQITNLSDVTLPTWNIGDPSVSASLDICIYTVNVLSSPDYGVTISSPGGYFLKSGAQQIPYALYWDDAGAGNLDSTVGTQLANGIKISNRQNASTLSVTCALGITGPNARLNIKITQADMNAALAGTYTGTITILISAN